MKTNIKIQKKNLDSALRELKRLIPKAKIVRENEILKYGFFKICGYLKSIVIGYCNSLVTQVISFDNNDNCKMILCDEGEGISLFPIRELHKMIKNFKLDEMLDITIEINKKAEQNSTWKYFININDQEEQVFYDDINEYIDDFKQKILHVQKDVHGVYLDEFDIDFDDLVKVNEYAGDESSRFAVKGVYFNFNILTRDIVATDGYRLIINSLSKGKDSEFSFILPSEAINAVEMSRKYNSFKNADIVFGAIEEYSINDFLKAMVIKSIDQQSGDLVSYIHTKCLDTTFPNYHNITYDRYDMCTRVVIFHDKENLIDKIDNILNNYNNGDNIRIDFSNSEISNGIDDNRTESIKITHDHEDPDLKEMSIDIDGLYFRDMIFNYDSDDDIEIVIQNNYGGANRIFKTSSNNVQEYVINKDFVS